MFEFLVKNNLLPYLVIALMAYGLYWQFERSIKLNLELVEAKQETQNAYATMGTLQNYNELQFQSLRETKQINWKEGKHERIIYFKPVD